MLFNEFKDRCYDEFNKKNPEASSKGYLGWVATVIGIVVCIVLIFFDKSEYFWLHLIIVIVAVSILSAIINSIKYGSVYRDVNRFIKQCKKDGSYTKYPQNYPYSLLYPGEPWPFEQIEETEEIEEIEEIEDNAPAPVSYEQSVQADVPADPVLSNNNPAEPELERIYCERCSQPMMIPMSNITVKVFCPNCGADFIHTPNK